VLAELLATILLWVGTIALVMALAGAATIETARMLATFGATAFIAVWSAFLIAGNYFCYWLGHEGAQTTHFHLTLSGLGTLILLAQH
jgi:predicted small integral membrane protein